MTSNDQAETTDQHALEMRLGDDYVGFSDYDDSASSRVAAVCFIVAKLDLSADEVSAARAHLGLDGGDA